jgi:hypothetical protein
MFVERVDERTARQDAIKMWNTRACDSESKTKRGDKMSVTDELRSWAARELAGWKMARERFDALTEIADRIDAEVGERYMRLPVGEDGKPIHVGDTVDWCFAGGKPIEVNGVSPTSLFYSDDGENMQWTTASNKRQVGEDK